MSCPAWRAAFFERNVKKSNVRITYSTVHVNTCGKALYNVTADAFTFDQFGTASWKQTMKMRMLLRPLLLLYDYQATVGLGVS